MFERRLKIVVIALVLMSMLLLSRVVAVQVVARSYWSEKAKGMLTKPQITETTRGRILDVRGNPLAMDIACTDACVDYRAIIDPPDPAWLKTIAITRLKAKMGNDYTATKGDKRRALIDQEINQVTKDIDTMWATLANLNPEVDPAISRTDAIANIRSDIIHMVKARRKDLLDRLQAREKARASTSSKLMKWLGGDASDSGADNLGLIQEQQSAHVVLPALDETACNLLGKRLDELPGLSLRPSTHRSYPMKTVACHLLGSMGHASDRDLSATRRSALDDLKQYLPGDFVGRNGVEALCEPLLRGSRGRYEKRVSDGAILPGQEFVPGSDVRLSIDADLQAQVQTMLQHVEEMDHRAGTLLTPPGGVSMHAAAVVLDIKTNEVRVLASNPGFDLNDLSDQYAKLRDDTMNEPLRNRATSDAFEPGSTVKPLIGLGAITQGILGPMDTIECTASLYLEEIGPDHKPHKIKMPRGRCWVLGENLAVYKGHEQDAMHHPIPSGAAHPTGFLTYADALERSCDIYFETVADRLGPDGVNHWYEQFGLGRNTGIGIHEVPGLRPEQWKGRVDDPRMNNCWAGMGQGSSRATALQIANEAATIARGGIWMRPRLLTEETQAELDAAHPPTEPRLDVVDLHLNPEALHQAHLGMYNVANSPAGTGPIPCPPGIRIAAKTGTADAAPIWQKWKDASGKEVKQKLTPVLKHGAETDTPWYRSTDSEADVKDDKASLVHGWYMGYAPADHPQIAFCVMVEYAGAGGGVSAGPIASHILEAAAKAGYLRANSTNATVAAGN